MNYIIKVRFFNGVSRSYRLPNDLKTAIDQYNVDGVKDNWKNFLLNALINVPLTSYVRGDDRKRQNPPIATAKITEALAIEKLNRKQKKLRISRSQFVKINSNDSYKAIKNKIKYMEHDYNISSKLKIRYDIYRLELSRGYFFGKLVDQLTRIHYISRLLLISPFPF